MKKLFDGNFDSILKDAHEKYQKKKSIYGESWKRMSENELHKRLVEELDEFDTSRHSYDELIDVINVSLMLAARIADDEEPVVILPSYDKGLISLVKKKDLRHINENSNINKKTI